MKLGDVPVLTENNKATPRQRCWNMEGALARIGGDLQLLRELTEVFLEEYPKTLLRLHSAIREQDHNKIREAIHSLKGELAYFAAEEAERELLQLRERVLGNDMPGAQHAAELVQRELDSLRPEMIKLLEAQT
jgi:two-component system sensor histidine kinase/response regulator